MQNKLTPVEILRGILKWYQSEDRPDTMPGEFYLAAESFIESEEKETPPAVSHPSPISHAGKTRRWSVSYAYDIPHYADFTIDAPTEDAALAFAVAALDAGKLRDILGDPDHESDTDHRVFVQSETDPEDDSIPTMEALIENSKSQIA